MLAVAEEIGRDKALEILEDYITSLALEWFDKNRSKLKLKGSLIDQAFEIFYFKHLNLKRDVVEIIEKTDKKLICRWRNFCGVLEAYKA